VFPNYARIIQDELTIQLMRDLLKWDPGAREFMASLKKRRRR
jgi:hypothetical protein